MCNVSILVEGVAEPIRLGLVDYVRVVHSDDMSIVSETLMDDDEIMEYEYLSGTDESYHFYSANKSIHMDRACISAINVTKLVR